MPACRRRRLVSQRLQAVHSALRPAAPAVGQVSEALKPLPLDVDGGGIAASKLAEIEAEKQKALAAEDFRLAGEMSDLLIVLTSSE